MKGNRFLLPLIIGFVFAAFTVVSFYFINLVPRPIGSFIFYFLFPGLILGLFAGGSVHDPNIPVAVLGNFLFYFGLTYLVAMRWKKPRVKPDQIE